MCSRPFFVDNVTICYREIVEIYFGVMYNVRVYLIFIPKCLTLYNRFRFL